MVPRAFPMSTDPLSADLASLRIARDEPPPPRRLGLWVAVVGGVVVAVVGVRSFAMPYAEARLFKTEVKVTEIGLVSPAQATVDLAATGYVVPQVVAKVGAKVTGRIAKVNLREGDSVKAGQLLFELDPSDQRSAVAAAAARVSAARAKAVAARARAAVARATAVETQVQYDRNKKLVERGAVPQATVDDLAAHLESLTNQVKASDDDASAAEADANAAQAEMSSLSVNLGNMTIESPLSGTAVTKPAQMGDVVTPSGTLVELADFDSLRVEVDVPESHLGTIRKGTPCEIVLDAFPDQRRRGEVSELGPRLDRAKATGVVKVRFVDGMDGVLPEMAARVSFLTKALDPSQMKAPPKKIVPASAIATRGGAKVVFVVDGDHVRMVPVTVGPAFAGGFELTDGPSPGAHVVKDPPANLADGQIVKESGGA
jgi:HlyD family secretion protein